MALYSKSSNPFENDEDEDNYSFDSRYKARQPQHDLEPSEGDRRRQLWQEVNDSESRQVASTRNALASIYESESMGVATAEELLRQSEQLDNIERSTTEINQMMKTSQKHLNNIKSVFGGLKNWWNKGSDNKDQPSKAANGSSGSKLSQALEEHKSSAPHPALRMKYDTSGFYDDEVGDIDDRFLAGTRKPQGTKSQQQMLTRVTHTEQEAEVDQNLAMMADGMARLKGLAIGLGSEIDRQNAQLDRINPNVDRAFFTMDEQLAQMRKIQNS